MSQDDDNVTLEMREHERIDFADPVTVDFDATPITGSGENISAQGVYLTIDKAIEVNVKIQDGSTVRGELVRAESMGDGRTGLAIRFEEPSAGLVD
ncbi:MAG: PilZ domain-containing protein [bacterium]|nr:PilZ domain-containing protein [bacterium]